MYPKSLPHDFGIYGHATLLVSQIGHGEIGRSASDKIFETKGLADVHQIMYEQRDNFYPKCVPITVDYSHSKYIELSTKIFN